MTTQVRAVVTLQRTSGVIGDSCVNVWAFHNDDDGAWSDGIRDGILGSLASFYNLVQPDPPYDMHYSLDNYLSPEIVRTPGIGGNIKLFDIDYGPGAPILGESSFSMVTSEGMVPLPEQVCLALSFHADETGVPFRDGTMRPQARRRGRIFFGPLNSQTQSAGNKARPDGDFMSDLVGSLKALADFAPWHLGVWSRSDTDGTHPHGTVRTAVRGSVDNRYDTQRRRMEAASSRIESALLY